MLERILRFFAVILVACLLLPGCGSFTKQGRQQISYQRYVNKCRKDRQRMEVRMAKPRRRIPAHKPSDYAVSAGTVDGPQSVPAESTGNQ